jgi:hypothetical protein
MVGTGKQHPSTSIAGIYRAIKAIKLDPIEHFREE